RSPGIGAPVKRPNALKARALFLGELAKFRLGPPKRRTYSSSRAACGRFARRRVTFAAFVVHSSTKMAIVGDVGGCARRRAPLAAAASLTPAQADAPWAASVRPPVPPRRARC